MSRILSNIFVGVIAIMMMGAVAALAGCSYLQVNDRNNTLVTTAPELTVTIVPTVQTVSHLLATATATAVPTACTNSAALVADVTVPDGTQFPPNTGFNKTWRIKNTGTCTWDSRYKLIHHAGSLLGAVKTV